MLLKKNIASLVTILHVSVDIDHKSFSAVPQNQSKNVIICEISQLLQNIYYNKVVILIVSHVVS